MKKAAPAKKGKKKAASVLEEVAAPSLPVLAKSSGSASEGVKSRKLKALPDISPGSTPKLKAPAPPPPPPYAPSVSEAKTERIDLSSFKQNKRVASFTLPDESGTGTNLNFDFVTEEAQKESGGALNEWLTNDELVKGKKALRQMNTGKASITLDRAALFDKHEISTHFPLEKLKDIFLHRSGNVTKILLVGVEQLTDLFFIYIDQLFGNDIMRNYVAEIILTGCSHITDHSLEIIVKLFPNLSKINIVGCKNITNRGLNLVQDKLIKIANINVTATSVSIIQPLDHSRTSVVIKLAGCPIISPAFLSDVVYNNDTASKNQYFIDLLNGPQVFTYRAMVVTNPDLNTSLIDLLGGSSDKSSENLAPFAVGTFNGSDGADYNLIECLPKMLPTLITQRTLYLLPVPQEKNFMHCLIQTIIGILLLDPYAVFCLVGVSADESSMNNIEGTKELILSTLANDTRGSLLFNVKKICKESTNHVAMSMKSLDFHMQRVCSDLWRLNSALSDELSGRIHVCSVMANQKDAGSVIEKCMQSALPALTERNKSYSALPKDLLLTMDDVPKQRGLKPAVVIAEPIRKKKSTVYGTQIKNHTALLDTMEILGRVVQLESDGTKYTVSDKYWLAEVLSCILSFPTSKVGEKITQVHPDTEAIYLPDLHEKLESIFHAEDEKGIEEMKKGFEVLRQTFQLGWTVGDWMILLTNLAPQPPVPVEPFLETDGSCSASITYNFNVPCPDQVVSHVLYELLQLTEPFLVWNKGALLRYTPVQVLLKFSSQKTKGLLPTTKAELKVTAPSMMQGLNQVDQMMYDHIVRNRVIMEYVFKQYNLSYTYNDSFDFKMDLVDLPENSLFNGGGDGRNFLYGHTYRSQPTCETCDENMPLLKRLWEMSSDIWPSFVDKNLCHLSKQVNQQGAWFDIPPSASSKGSVTCSLPLSPYVFNKADITMLNQGQTTLISVTAATANGGEEKYQVRKGKEGKGGDDGLTTFERIRDGKAETISMTPGDVDLGRTIQIQLQTNQESKPRLEFISGGEKVMEGTLDVPNCHLQVSSETQLTFLLNASKHPGSSIKMDWEVGMRLEATDRLNPNLICVATVNDKKMKDGEVSEILIHFDGWTNRYDFWTEPSAHDLHPIGFTRQKGSEIGYSKLEAPKGYSRGRFDWNTYLNEVLCLPVPYDLFSEEQTKGCEPFIANYDQTPDYIEGQQYMTALRKCRNGLNPIATLKKGLNQMKSTDLKSLVDETSRETKKHPFVIPLPKNLSVDDLKYPKIPNFKEQTLNVICINNGFLHFIDMAGMSMDEAALETLKNGNTGALSTALGKLVTQDHILPKKVKSLIKEASDIPLEQLETFMKSLLLDMIVVFGHRPRDDHSKSNNYEQLCKSTVDRGMREHDLSEHLKVDEDSIYWCTPHMNAAPRSGLTEVPMQQLEDYHHLTTCLKLSHNSITELPENFFENLPVLQVLDLSENQISSLPSFAAAKLLRELNLSNNKISNIPADIASCPIQELNISGNALSGIPGHVLGIGQLRFLEAGNVGLTKLEDSIKKLSLLEELNIQGHCLEVLPAGLGELTNLKKLNISGIPWFNQDNNRAVLSRQAFDDFMNSNPITAEIPDKEKNTLFNGEGVGQQSTLDYKGIVKLNTNIFMMFPRLGNNSGDSDDDQSEKTEGEDILAPLFGLTKLTDLVMNYLGFKIISDKVSSLKELQHLDVSHNPRLETISAEVGVLANINALHLKDCNSLKTPPKEIVRRGYKAIMGYLRRLQMGSVSCKRTKLMMVGLGGAGKTSTMKALMSHKHQSDGDAFVTDGIDILTWKVCYDQSSDNSVTYSVWDFAGQTVYYNTHQFFLSNRAIYLLMWNVRLGHEHAGLDFWLSSIACHAPKAPILVIGTHIDQVEKFWLPSEEIQKRYPQICGFYSVSSYTGDGIDGLAQEIYNVALKEKYMGEKIPQAWLNLEESIVRRKSEKSESLLEWQEIEAIAETVGIVETTEVMQAIRFLHDLGSIQHFDNDFLRSKVVINPQWIVNVMSCVVSVHENAIKDGKLLHKDIAVIWRDYDSSLHEWLLRLTEEFDLTFPLHNEKANLVACLLQDKKPEFAWPDVSDIPGQHETKMIYKFDYLPAGLFNRAQVRLHQYSDNAILWKKGSILNKTGHKALMTQKAGARVEVRVQGPCPENFLFLVHEVYETLISEAYNGVSYDFLIPCSDCIKAGTYDPCMFEASKIRRATELKVPFLQCDKYFHTLSLTEIHASMPPDSSSDFDAHLERSIRDLKDLRSDMETDVFMFYCNDDVPQTGDDKKIEPRTVYNDLLSEGFKVWFTPDPKSVNLKSIAMTMKNSGMVLILVSDKFVMDNDCCNVFYYAKHTLHKRLQIISLGGNQWPKSDIGLQIASEVYVKMDDKKRYTHKKPELIKALGSKTKATMTAQPKCFFSYCWSNSHDAIKKGSRKVEGALGWGDPRDFKDYIEKAGVSCWMDIEQVGQGGLFEDIATGLRHAKAIVACVSDEYAKSKNCQMELRFAVTTLRLPLVVVVVGTGYQWEASEVGMLTLGSPKINCQYESASAKDRILSAVQAVLPKDDQEESQSSLEKKKNDEQHQAYQELLELAQRKFLRQVNVYANAMDCQPYPRLFFLDFATENDKVNESQTATQCTGGDKARDGECENAIQCTEDAKGDTKEDLSDTDLRSAKYVVRILCEHEQGWHVPGASLPLPTVPVGGIEEQLDTIAPYGARIMAILRHTPLDFSVLNTDRGEALRAKFEEGCSLDTDFQQEYSYFRNLLIQLDKTNTMGGLTKCHLPNGMVVWLCEEHRTADPRISKVSEGSRSSGQTEMASINPDQITKSQKPKLRGKFIGAGAAAAVAGIYEQNSGKNQQSATCNVM